MNVDKPFAKYSLLSVVAALIVAGSLSLVERNHAAPNGSVATLLAENVVQFSPSEDLESADIKLLKSANSTIDVAMYAFTDERIEAALEQAARRGVKIRIYRDALQLADEEGKAARGNYLSMTDRLVSVPGIEIRVKGRGQIMHLKAYCIDKGLLRTGSANWSPQGEMDEDNDIYVVRDQDIVKRFQTDFDSIWNRSNNVAK